MENLVMPPEIAAAIIWVLAKIKVIVKDNMNKHGGYKYVSYDSFLEIIGPLLAEAGLIIVMNETEAHSDGKWLSLTFHIYIYHSSGKSFGPMVRTQAVMANGPQAYAAAQSFVEKYFMRQLFKIPTGEEALDEGAFEKAALPTKAKSKEPALMTATESSDALSNYSKTLDAITDKQRLLDWAKNTSAIRALMAIEDRAVLTKKYKEVEAKLEGALV